GTDHSYAHTFSLCLLILYAVKIVSNKHHFAPFLQHDNELPLRLNVLRPDWRGNYLRPNKDVQAFYVIMVITDVDSYVVRKSPLLHLIDHDFLYISLIHLDVLLLLMSLIFRVEWWMLSFLR